MKYILDYTNIYDNKSECFIIWNISDHSKKYDIYGNDLACKLI